MPASRSIRCMQSEAGDDELQRWFTVHADAVACYLRARLAPAVRASLTVEDMMQEVWLRAVRVRPATPIANPRAWLVSIAAYVVLEGLRSLRRRPLGRQPVTEDGCFAIPDEVTSVTRRVARAEQRQRFFAALDDLGDEERAILLHHGIEERPLTVLAERFGIGVEAMHKRWQRLRERLRTLGSPTDLF